MTRKKLLTYLKRIWVKYWDFEWEYGYGAFYLNIGKFLLRLSPFVVLILLIFK